MNIADHWLEGDQVTRTPCSKTSGDYAENRPDTVVIHYTAAGSVDSAVRTLTDLQVKASAHLVIGQKGEIVQMIPFDKIAWHAGVSNHQGRQGLNAYSIGIELDNAGKLEKTLDAYTTWFGKKIPANEVTQAKHRDQRDMGYWHVYPEIQLETLISILQILIPHYSIKWLVGHDEIAPGRKQDPGPAFPIERFRARLLDNDRKEGTKTPMQGRAGALEEAPRERGLVTATRLNFRSGPNDHAATVAEPLRKGQGVTILSERNGWLEVEVATTGWVDGRYIRKMSS